MLYLDTLASYPMLKEAQEALLTACQEHFANPSANHILGEEALAQIETVRSIIADTIGALPSEIIFTSGATESNNLALKSIVDLTQLPASTPPHIITSAIEHKCILEICDYLESIGCEVTYITPSKDGYISVSSVEQAIKPNTVLISIMHVNNELGTINNIEKIGEACFKKGIKFHTDAAQSYLKVPIDVDDLNLDFLSISAHKIGGIKGIGAIYIRDSRNTNLQPLIHGAGQELGLRGGTLATPLIASFGAAVKHFPIYYKAEKLKENKKFFLEELLKHEVNYLVNGGQDTLPLMVNISFLNIDVPALIRENLNKYALSQGSACSSGSIEPSHVLQALSIDRETASNTLRISFSSDVTKDQLKELASDIANYRK